MFSPAVRRSLKAAAITLFIAYLAFVGFVWSAMKRPPEGFGRVMSKMPEFAYFLVPFETMWMKARGGSLRVGDAAPDFSLPKLDKTGHVQLASTDGAQPAVLIFGSYT